MLHPRFLRVLGSVLLMMVASGCASQRALRPKDIRVLPHSTGPGTLQHVDGLREALARSPAAPVQVLVLHGMITGNRGYSKRLQENLAAKLGLTKGATLPSVLIQRGYDITLFSGPQPFGDSVPLRPSEIQKTIWVDAGNPRVPRLIFHEMVWGPLRDDVKNRFLACFESRSVDHSKCTHFSAALPNADSRAWINGELKDRLLVGGFADATIVLGPVGDVLRDDVALAMCMIATDVLAAKGVGTDPPSGRCDLLTVAPHGDSGAAANRALQEAEFFAITHSLGSFLVLDTQQRSAGKRPIGGGDVARETSAFHLLDDATVFMRANQISLLQLGRLTPVCTSRDGSDTCPNTWLPTLDAVMEGGDPLMYRTTYVAFNDVDDLLGFELPPYLPDTGLVGTLVNVSVRNPGLRIFRLFKHPGAAHLASDRNRAIIQAIVEGIDLPVPSE